MTHAVIVTQVIKLIADNEDTKWDGFRELTFQLNHESNVWLL